MDGELALDVLRDIVSGITIEHSRHGYDSEAIEYRDAVEKWYAELKARDPDAIMEIPEELIVGDAFDPGDPENNP